MNNGFSIISDFLGKETTDELKNGIKELILDRIKQDLDDSDLYLVCPDDLTDFVEGCRTEALDNVRKEFVNHFEEQLRNSIKS